MLHFITTEDAVTFSRIHRHLVSPKWKHRKWVFHKKEAELLPLFPLFRNTIIWQHQLGNITDSKFPLWNRRKG